MVLTEKETSVIEDLRQQEQSCIEKYKRYSSEAKDPVLRDLFNDLQKEEKEHYESLGKVLNGSVPSCNCNDRDGAMYQPKATYDSLTNSEDKKNDCFLATDCIGTEKMVSGTYNTDVFVFGDTKIRKLLADIQVEEQNHAEMLYKYKTVNGMA
ncbi:MAG: ferritin-like domain-containing protein [Blautia sp.]|nr:ferritin-like domain-containing protein [Blautia sp.]MCM1284238.1 ferritin-like domain-containing protein [Roseburia sp.]MCM1430758.1 ferritin-like domain-containing protein [Muribaculaceae bacterium]MCM1492737.1 ferritin-like domain-containing protein [Muribaculaceae bacterium]